MIKNIVNLVKRGVSLAANDQFVVSVGNSLTIILIGKFAGESTFGMYAYIITAQRIFTLINNEFFFVNAASKLPEIKNKDSYLANLKLLHAIVALTLSLMGLVFYFIWFVGIITLNLLVIFFFYWLFFQLAEFERRKGYFLKKIGISIKISYCQYGLRISFLLLHILAGFELNLEAIFMYHLAGSFLGFFVAPKFSTTCVSLTEIQCLIREYFHGGKWLLINIPLTILYARSPVFLIGEFIGIKYAGYLLGIRNITNTINLGLELMNTYFFARLSELWFQNKQAFKKYFLKLKVIGIFAWLVFLIIIFWGGELILLFLFNPSYMKFQSVLAILWVSNLFLFLNRLNLIQLKLLEKTYIIPISNALGILTMYLIFFLSNYSLLNLSFAMILASFTYFLIGKVCLINLNREKSW